MVREAATAENNRILVRSQNWCFAGVLGSPPTAEAATGCPSEISDCGATGGDDHVFWAETCGVYNADKIGNITATILHEIRMIAL
jgi:hypothetical protein